MQYCFKHQIKDVAAIRIWLLSQASRLPNRTRPQNQKDLPTQCLDRQTTLCGKTAHVSRCVPAGGYTPQRKTLTVYVQLLFPNSAIRLSCSSSKGAIRKSKNKGMFPKQDSLHLNREELFLLTDVTDIGVPYDDILNFITKLRAQ